MSIYRTGGVEMEEQKAFDEAVDRRLADRSFVGYVRAQKEWSERTFGPGMRTMGVLDHMKKEMLEVINAPTDVGEWVDLIILAIDGAWRCGASPEEVAEALSAKQAKNFGRVWPDWRTMSEDQAIEHDRMVEVRFKPCEFCGTELQLSRNGAWFHAASGMQYCPTES